MAKFFRGKKASFKAETHKDGLFFATDVNELYMSYEVEGEIVTRVYGSEYLIKDINLVDNNTIKIDYRDESLESKTINLIELLQKATSEAAGLMSADDKAHFDTLWSAFENDELGKVQGIVEEDKILSLDNDKLLSALVSLKYDPDNHSIQLLGKKYQDENGEEKNYVLGEVDATPFIHDGMLDDVEIITEDGKKYIEFTWKNVIDEDTKELKKDRIAVADLLISYTGGNGISIDENYAVNIDLASGTGVLNNITTKTNGEDVTVTVNRSKNFLEFDNDDKLRVSAITTDASILQKDITVAGLDGKFGAGYNNNDIIKAGTSIYDILVKMLSKEIYPGTASMSNAGGLTSKFSNPSFTLGQSGKTVEVGTKVDVSGVTGYDPTATPTSRQYTGFTNGYSLEYNYNGSTGKQEVDNNYADDYAETISVSTGNPSNVSFPTVEEYLAEKDGERTYTGDGKPVTLNYGTFTLTRTYSGFGKSGLDLTTTSSVTTKAKYGEGETPVTSASCTISGETNLVVKEGTNKVTYKMEGPGHRGTIPSSPKYYVVSNLGNAKSTLSVAAQEAKPFNTDNPTNATAGSTEKTVTGSYYNIYQMSATTGITPVTQSDQATDSAVGVGKKYKTFNSNTKSFSITANTVAEIVILSKSLTVTKASWVSAGFTQDWIGSVKNEVGKVDFTLPDGSTVKYNKITIVASDTGDKFGTDGTLNITY